MNDTFDLPMHDAPVCYFVTLTDLSIALFLH